MLENANALKAQFEEAISKVTTTAEIDALRIEYAGKNYQSDSLQ